MYFSFFMWRVLLKTTHKKIVPDGALPIENNGTLQVHFDAFLGA